jgi:hypothetical protein
MAHMNQEHEEIPKKRTSTIYENSIFIKENKEKEDQIYRTKMHDFQSEFTEADTDANHTKINKCHFSHLQNKPHNHRDTKHNSQITIDDSYLTGCFDMISDFQDLLGRKSILAVDFSKIIDLHNKSDEEMNYLSVTYKYIQQNFMEKLSQLSMQLNKDLPKEQQQKLAKDTQGFFLSKLKQSKILKQLLVNRY